MSCHMHCFAEKKIDGEWVDLNFSPFYQSYSIFGFLANVRNYSAVTPIIAERRGFPENSPSYFIYKRYIDGHSPSYLLIEELLKFDYYQSMEDRRIGKQITPTVFDGSWCCEKGHGILMTYKKFLGELYFKDLEKLKELKAERIVFWFDN